MGVVRQIFDGMGGFATTSWEFRDGAIIAPLSRNSVAIPDLPWRPEVDLVKAVDPVDGALMNTL